MNSIDDDIIIHPMRARNEKAVPSLGILFVNPVEAKKALQVVIDAGGERLFLHNSTLATTVDGRCFVAGPAIGAPFATLVMEKLIVLGAKKIVMMGWCGSLDPDYHIGDIIVPVSAVSGEGTSKYYSFDQQADPSVMVAQYLTKILIEDGGQVKSGKIWSTDAPYRESKKFLRKIHKEDQVIGVDMEFSALCNVAHFRKIEFNAVMVVSDVLWGESWRPGFKESSFKNNCNAVVGKLLEMEF